MLFLRSGLPLSLPDGDGRLFPEYPECGRIVEVFPRLDQQVAITVTADNPMIVVSTHESTNSTGRVVVVDDPVVPERVAAYGA